MRRAISEANWDMFLLRRTPMTRFQPLQSPNAVARSLNASKCTASASLEEVSVVQTVGVQIAPTSTLIKARSSQLKKKSCLETPQPSTQRSSRKVRFCTELAVNARNLAVRRTTVSATSLELSAPLRASAFRVGIHIRACL